MGYAASRITASASSWDFGHRVARLETLVVSPGARSRGVGGLLVERLREHRRAADVRIGTVSVIAANSGAQRFYKRMGAVEFTRTSDFPV